MKWLRWFERRAVPTWSTRQSLEDFTALFGGGTTSSTVDVTPENAVNVPAVFACIQVLSQDVARAPIKLRRKTAEDTYVDAVEHDLWEILHDLPNAEHTAFEFKAAMMRNLLQYGRAYAEVIRSAGRVTALWALDSRYMRVDRDEARRKRWTYSGAGKTFSWLFDPSTPPILELTYDSPIARCRELIGIALALQTFTGKFFAGGGRLPGALQAAGTLTDASMKRIRAAWDAAHSGPANSHKVALLEGGLKYEPFAANNEEAQLEQLLHAITTQICGAFRVPPFKVADLSKATYSNMETGELAYVTSTLDPFFELWENAIRRDLLTTRQFPQYAVTFDRSSLIRSDAQSLHGALSTGLQAGFYSQNDCRRALGLNPIPDGDGYVMNSALVPVGGDRNAA